jgi:hypothetical protein
MTHRGRFALLVAVLTLSFALSFCSGASTAPDQAAGTKGAPADAAEPAAAPAPDQQAAPQPATDDGASSDAALEPMRAAGAVQGVPAPTNTAPIVAVANYFTELPGVDLASLRPRQKEKFLQRVNSEVCTCGCKNDTLAHCYVNDPRCPVVKGMVQRVLDEVKAGK